MIEVVEMLKWRAGEALRRIERAPLDIRHWWFLRTHPNKALFKIGRIKDGRVKALRCDFDTGSVLKGDAREEFEFDHADAPWLSSGDLHVVYSK